MRGYLVLFLLFPYLAAAQLQLASIFSDNMVLQRKKTIYLWATGVPGSQVSVNLEIKR